MVRFATAEEAEALRAAVDAALALRATPAVVREAWDGDRAPARQAWAALAATGLTGTLVSEADGGIGLDENALMPALEDVGATALPVPMVESVAVAAPLLARAGHPALAGVLTGKVLIAAQFTDSAVVPFGADADYVVLTDAAGSLVLHERAALPVDAVPTVDRARNAVRLRERPVGGLVLADAAQARQGWQRGVLGTSAVLIGLASRMLSLTVAHVTTREQFGVPIGSFQAVKHHLADVLLAIEFARPAVLAAAWSQAVGAQDAAQRTSLAKVLASDAADLAAEKCLQCHGAIGYTTEYDLHLYAKRSWALARSWGTAREHRAEIAADLGLTTTTEKE